MIAGVLVELSNKNIDKIFDYIVPDNLIDKMKIGIRVEVPFGYQTLEGFVLELKDEYNLEHKLKDIIDIVDEDIVLNEELITLGKLLRKQTISTLISCYQVMLPKALKAKNGTVINKKYYSFYKLNKDKLEGLKLNDKQQEIVKLFKEKDLIERKILLDISPSSLKTLVKKEVLDLVEKEHYRLEYNDKKTIKNELTPDQDHVVKTVLENPPDNYLLFGVTGSGKTEVYMELIEDALNKEKTSIVLVPEISLTPQMVRRFEERFGSRIAALHSSLSEGEKYDEWRRIAKGEASIVIGARSAIFAPLKNLGMIIIDEEHSDSYKQDNNPRYSAIEVAKLRAKYNNCSLIMGSATPSLDSFARAKKQVYKLLELPNRVNGKSLPKVKVIDMNEEIRRGNGHFSKELLDSIKEKIENHEQVILLLNRRGYSSFVTCKNCGYTATCPNCDITLTYHKTSNTLRCHYCGYGEKLLTTCPSCKENSINDLGVGTEKIEEELHNLIDAKILRMDFDTTSRKGMHEIMIKAFRAHEYDILLGTQIVAKGLDFDNVTLVGVINADTSLNIPDFRSSENTFSLLSQVAGRSGRSAKEGIVIIQTFNKEHYAIEYASHHDYLGFYNKEMYIRRQMKYPPFYYICYLKISSKDYKVGGSEANKIKRALEKNLTSTIILGPTPANIFKVNNIFRYGIILKYKKEDNLIPILEKLQDHYKSNNKITIDIDFNPNHF